MKKLLVCAALVSVSTTGSAQERKPLWNNLYIGMTKAEVKALYPKTSIPLDEQCFADLFPRYEQGRLAGVNLEYSYKDKSKSCRDMVRETLVHKYGEPDDRDQKFVANYCGNTYAGGVAGFLANLCEASGGDQPSTIDILGWVEGDIQIIYKSDNSTDNKWNVYYQPVVKPSAAAATKL